MRLRPAFIIALLAVGAVLGLPACGSDDDAAGDSSSDQAQAQSPDGETATETAPDLTDTSVKPVIPDPTGSPPRRLTKDDIVKGKGRPARLGDTVVVHYVGVTFSNGREFDSSWDRAQPFPVKLGDTRVIKGWTRGLVGVRKGGRREVVVPPELGYGRAGAPPDIGPNETLVFVFDVLAVL